MCALALAAVGLAAGCRAQMLGDPAGGQPRGPSDPQGGTLDDASTRGDASGPAGGLADAGLSPPACTSACCAFVSPNCPPTAPAPGTPCGPPSQVPCEYGDDPNMACNTLVQCTAGGWMVQGVFGDPQGSCPTPASVCPPSYPGAADGGGECPSSEQGFSCVYPEGVCACFGAWSCDPFPNQCPATRPRAGTPCDADGGGCREWGLSCNSNSMHCVCGVWSPSICLLI